MNNKNLLIYIAAGVGLICGIAIGMILQQMLFTTSFIGIAEGLEGTTFNVEVDINETLMVDRLYEKMEESGLLNITNESVHQVNERGMNNGKR